MEGYSDIPSDGKLSERSGSSGMGTMPASATSMPWLVACSSNWKLPALLKIRSFVYGGIMVFIWVNGACGPRPITTSYPPGCLCSLLSQKNQGGRAVRSLG